MCEGDYPFWVEISFHFLAKDYTLTENVPKGFVRLRDPGVGLVFLNW